MNMKMASKIKDKWLILVVNIVLLIYIVVIGSVGFVYNWKCQILGGKVDLIVLLILMFIFELISTITFQLRIWLTSKSKIRYAATIGAFSWLIAGLQGLFLINGSIEHVNEAATFFIKMPPVFIATFTGIITNNVIKNLKNNI